jgi:thiamine phosphate synthase YjbQ (UPF0047 family)
MSTPEAKVELELKPEARLDIINVNQFIQERFGDRLSRFRKALYCSYHTTAGYLEQSLSNRLSNDPDSIREFVNRFQRLFPPDADYRHDQMHLREELSEAQKLEEPLNADSHLTYIGSGLSHCVTYDHPAESPVFFIDLDGICGKTQRRRKTTVVGFNREFEAKRVELGIPVSQHPIDSVSLKTSELGVFDEIDELIRQHQVRYGRVDIQLVPEERHAGLTVNEYETLLMRHDLVEVLKNPLRFMAEKGKHVLSNPRAVPGKVLNYAKYDLVQIVNEFVDATGLNETLLERIIDKFLAVPAERALRMKRSVSLLIASEDGDNVGSVVEGTYQSPILVQWRRSEALTRRVNVRLVRFE